MAAQMKKESWAYATGKGVSQTCRQGEERGERRRREGEASKGRRSRGGGRRPGEALTSRAFRCKVEGERECVLARGRVRWQTLRALRYHRLPSESTW